MDEIDRFIEGLINKISEWREKAEKWDELGERNNAIWEEIKKNSNKYAQIKSVFESLD